MVQVCAVVVALAILASGCGRSVATHTGRIHALVDRTIPGAPDTPRWLRVRIWRTASGLGDANPSRIVVHRRVRDHGRVVDRVWMRGHFVCDTCSRPPGAKAPRGHLAGFTVVDSSHQDLSFSLQP